MFPNQAGRDSWGSPIQGTGYYGSGYGPTGSWYNWSGQNSGRSSNTWGYNPQPHGLEAEAPEPPQSSPYSKSPKLGINTNIYSIYQNRNQNGVGHDSATLTMHPQQNNKLPRADLISPAELEAGRGAESVEDLFTSCMQEQTNLATADTHKNAGEGRPRSVNPGEELDDGCVDTGKVPPDPGSRKYDQPELTIDEGTMEPDSSTDALPDIGPDIHANSISNSRSPRDARFAQDDEDAVGDLSLQNHTNTGSKMYPSQHQPYLMSQGGKGVSEQNPEHMPGILEGAPMHASKPPPLVHNNTVKSFPAAQLFKVKSESQLSNSSKRSGSNLSQGQGSGSNQSPGQQGSGYMDIFGASNNKHCDVEAKKRKLEAALLEITARERNAALKQANGGLPLSVEINDGESGSEQGSPQGKLVGEDPWSILTRPDAFLTSTLNHRKRGRKPKHYSEILQELGMRGISITKTHRSDSPPGSHRPGHPHHQPTGGGPHTPGGQPNTSFNPADHKTGNQQLQCPHCNKILTTSVGLMYHIRLHTGEKPYNCNLCGKSFATSSHYHYHIRTHSGEKPYRCDFCGKMYTASGSLRLHLKSHLSRLSANVLSLGMNMENMNMFRGLESLMGGDRGGQPGGGGSGGQPGLGGGGAEGHPPDTKSYIKQEVITEDHIGKGSGHGEN